MAALAALAPPIMYASADHVYPLYVHNYRDAESDAMYDTIQEAQIDNKVISTATGSLCSVKIIQPMALLLMDPVQQHKNFKVSPTMINFLLMYLMYYLYYVQDDYFLQLKPI